MRRGVEAGAGAGRGGHGGKESGGGALAVAARDEHGGVPELRIALAGEEIADPLHAETDAQRFEPGEERSRIAQGR